MSFTTSSVAIVSIQACACEQSLTCLNSQPSQGSRFWITEPLMFWGHHRPGSVRAEKIETQGVLVSAAMCPAIESLQTTNCALLMSNNVSSREVFPKSEVPGIFSPVLSTAAWSDKPPTHTGVIRRSFCTHSAILTYRSRGHCLMESFVPAAITANEEGTELSG